MGFENNPMSFPDALPRYVDGFADRFEATYDGPVDVDGSREEAVTATEPRLATTLELSE